jgi:peptide/nickel transport system ATP-binding protein
MIAEQGTPARARPVLSINDLTIEAVNRTGSAVRIVSGISLRVQSGEIVGLLGESGSGKTMICRAITGALPPGIRITRGSIERGDRRPAAVFADPHASLDPLQKVGNQIAEVARVVGGATKTDAKAQALRYLDTLSVRDSKRVYGQYPFQVSGGMAQRVVLAAALAMRPHFIVADEPTSALDATVQLDVLAVLQKLVREEGVGILLTTHDIAVAARVCTSIAVLYAGKVCELGTVDQVLRSPRHPYTRLLLASRPQGNRGQRLVTIPGDALSPGDPRPPCPFAPRCPRVADVCLQVEPLLEGVTGALVACHFPHGPDG